MDRNAMSPSPSSGVPHNGRRDVRLAAPEKLRCAIRGAAAVFTVNNISVGGFGASANMPLGRDTVYEFEFTFEEIRFVRKARVMHCAWIEGDRWNLGAAFQHDGNEAGTELLLDRITSTALDFS